MKIYIVVSKYQRSTDHYGGRITDIDIHDAFSTPEAAEQYVATADRTGPSVPEWLRDYSIVERELNAD